MSKIAIAVPEPSYDDNGKQQGYQVTVRHEGLQEEKVLKDKNLFILRSKAHMQSVRWTDRWQRVRVQLRLAEEREKSAEAAKQATAQAQQAIDQCSTILKHTLDIDDAVDWNVLKQHAPYSESPTNTTGLVYDRASGEPTGIETLERPPKPREAEPQFQPNTGLLGKVLPGRAQRAEQQANQLYRQAMSQWSNEAMKISVQEEQLRGILSAEHAKWLAGKRKYQAECDESDAKVDALRQSYLDFNMESVAQHAELVLNKSSYPDWFAFDFEVTYEPAEKLIIVDYTLPARERVPSLQSVHYSVEHDAHEETHLSDDQHDQLYDRVCYQVALRTIHELSEADEADAIESVVFNGWINDQLVGGKTHHCVMSVRANKERFNAIDLSRADPAQCFKRLNGVSVEPLASVEPVEPLISARS